jgi:hypothetical protein
VRECVRAGPSGACIGRAGTRRENDGALELLTDLICRVRDLDYGYYERHKVDQIYC